MVEHTYNTLPMKMKQPKALKLKLKGQSRPTLLTLKVNKEEKDYFNKALDELNAISPILQFTLSDFHRMALTDLSERIIKEVIKIELDIPNRTITFPLDKTKRVIPKLDKV